LLLVGLFILIHPLFSIPTKQLSDAQFQPPNGQHWLGTDVWPGLAGAAFVTGRRFR
jgi:hypothetical protein